MTDAQKFRTMDWLVGAATTVALTVAAWTLTRTIDHETRLSTVEDTRFTREDGEQLKADVFQRMQVPQPWIVQRLEQLAVDQQRLLETQRGIRADLQALTREIDKGRP